MIKVKMLSNVDVGDKSFICGKEYLIDSSRFKELDGCCKRLDYVSISPRQIDSVLVAKSNGLGNVINVTPLIRKLKLVNPKLNIDVMVLPPYVDIFKAMKEVRTVYTHEEFLRMSPVLKKWDIVINGLPADFALPGVDSTKVITGEREWLKTIHEVEANIKILEITEEDISYVPDTYITLTDKAIKKADETLEKEGRYIAINAGYTKQHDYWKIKHWGDENFNFLVELLLIEYPGHKMVIIGVEGEDKFLQVRDKRIVSLTGKMSILETGAVLSRCDFLVTNDSGNAHLASAVGCPTFTIFGPTSIIKNHPWNKSTVITKGLDCSPCQFTSGWPKCKTKDCMKITAEEVMQTIREKKKPKELSIIVNTYKRYEMLVCFFNNLLSWRGLSNIRLVLIDDHSDNEKIKALINSFRAPFEAKGNELVYIGHSYNYGKENFAQSIQEGIDASAGSEHILFTSDDVMSNLGILDEIRKSYHLLNDDVQCINFFVDTRKNYKNGAGIYGTKGSKDGKFEYVKWNDGFLTLYKTVFLEHVKIYGSPSEMGSGVWFCVNKYIENSGLKQLRTKSSFAEHIGNIKSTMNNEWRKYNHIDAIDLRMWND